MLMKDSTIAEETEHIIDIIEQIKTDLDETENTDTLDPDGYRHIPIVIEYTKDGVKAIEPVDKSANETKDKSAKPLEETIITPYLESQEGKKQAEKKKSFIKEWQKELKEFFSIGDKKKSASTK